MIRAAAAAAAEYPASNLDAITVLLFCFDQYRCCCFAAEYYKNLISFTVLLCALHAVVAVKLFAIIVDCCGLLSGGQRLVRTACGYL
jgi:hypothetical protein